MGGVPTGIPVKAKDGTEVCKVLVSPAGKEVGNILAVLNNKGHVGVLQRDGFDLTEDDLVFPDDNLLFVPKGAQSAGFGASGISSSSTFGAASDPSLGMSSSSIFGAARTPIFQTGFDGVGMPCVPANTPRFGPGFGAATGPSLGVSSSSMFGASTPNSGTGFIAASGPSLGMSSSSASTPRFGTGFGAASGPGFGTGFCATNTPAFPPTSTRPFSQPWSSVPNPSATPLFQSISSEAAMTINICRGRATGSLSNANYAISVPVDCAITVNIESSANSLTTINIVPTAATAAAPSSESGKGTKLSTHQMGDLHKQMEETRRLLDELKVKTETKNN